MEGIANIRGVRAELSRKVIGSIPTRNLSVRGFTDVLPSVYQGSPKGLIFLCRVQRHQANWPSSAVSVELIQRLQDEQQQKMGDDSHDDSHDSISHDNPPRVANQAKQLWRQNSSHVRRSRHAPTCDDAVAV